MVEFIPYRQYKGYTHDLLRLERNMRLKRKGLMLALEENEIAPTVSKFPLLGVFQQVENVR